MPISTEEVWRLLHEPLWRFIRRRVPDEESAADLLQEVFLRVHQHIDALQTQEKLEPWVYQIARHLVIDYYRRRQAAVRLAEAAAALVEDPSEQEPQARACIRAAVVALLRCLPAADREALTLTDYEGYSQRELARRLRLSLSGAKSRVQRAREKLRKLLLACCHVEFDRLGRVIDYQSVCVCSAQQCCDCS
jgi:RNA polymerase sigma-70 factor (ECF subfamily)